MPVNADDNSLLWEVSGKGLKKPTYIFGTFHMMCKDDIHFSETLKQAFASSDHVYFEMDLDDLSNTLGGLLFMNMKDGKTLKDLYTPEEYAKVETYFKDSLRTPLSLVHRMKPLFLQAMMYPKLMPCKNMSGIEQELMVLAKDQKKEIKGFEDIAFQSSVFDSIPYDVQAKELLKGIDSLHSYADEFNEMLDVYKTQRVMEIEKLFNESDFTMGAGQEILLDNRNKNWVKQLNEIMPKSNVFVAVGAGHLPGKNGVLNLLKEQGYTVRPLANK
ncbi:MAG: TraB/GumN family protein [Chitinophagaceae bacterium]|nr:MAG: TraB/GumN family protein [Chitinophagaceae bacterium]